MSWWPQPCRAGCSRQDAAHLDDEDVWPVSFAMHTWTSEVGQTVGAAAELDGRATGKRGELVGERHLAQAAGLGSPSDSAAAAR